MDTGDREHAEITLTGWRGRALSEPVISVLGLGPMTDCNSRELEVL